MKSDFHRIFVAVPLDEGLRNAILDLQKHLEDAGAVARWIRPEQLHFTLRFLGEISLAQVARVKVASREAAARIDPFTVTLRGLGAFPSLHRPQVVWAGVEEGREPLQALAGHLQEALARQRFPAEPKPFRPHLTLARVKSTRNWGELVRALGAFKDEGIGTQRVDILVVFESHLTPKGPRYTPLEEVRLAHYEK
ncbi:MAG: RNA 2',3'-cyclic phosphodiesterase [Gaiellales bacterium]